MAQFGSRVSYRALAVVFGILAIFLIIYADLQARLRGLGTTDLVQTISATTVTSTSSTPTELLTHRELMTAMLLAGVVIIAAMIVSVLFTIVSGKHRLSNARNLKLAVPTDIVPPEDSHEERVR